MKKTLLAVVLLVFVLSACGTRATPGIGPEAVWSVDPSEFQNCLLHTSSSTSYCLISQMQASKASPQAIAFTKLLQGGAFMSSFTEYGVVDLAGIIYPERANENFQLVLINGTPQIVYVEEVWKVDLTQDPNYPVLKQSYTLLSIDGIERGENSLESMERLSQGGQRFIFIYRLTDGCHACQTVSSAYIAFDFDGTGQFEGAKLLYIK
jgi:hypothetical protein